MAISILQPGGVLPPVGNLVLVQLFMYRSSQIGITGCHFQIFSSTATSAHLGDVAFEVQTAVSGALVSLMDSDTEILGCKATAPEISPLPLAGIAVDDATGGEAPPGLPGQDSGLITKTTDFSGRTFRGRCYVPFPYTAAQDDDDTPTADYVERLAVFANDFLTTQNVTAGGGLVVLKPVLYNRATVVITPITGNTPRKKWATQRRRGNYGRANGPFVS